MAGSVKINAIIFFHTNVKITKIIQSGFRWHSRQIPTLVSWGYIYTAYDNDIVGEYSPRVFSDNIQPFTNTNHRHFSESIKMYITKSILWEYPLRVFFHLSCLFRFLLITVRVLICNDKWHWYTVSTGHWSLGQHLVSPGTVTLTCVSPIWFFKFNVASKQNCFISSLVNYPVHLWVLHFLLWQTCAI